MGAIIKHLAHISHIRGVETGYIETCQTTAIHKHATIIIMTAMLNLPPRTFVTEYTNYIAHGNDIGGVEIGEVKARKLLQPLNMASMC